MRILRSSSTLALMLSAVLRRCALGGTGVGSGFHRHQRERSAAAAPRVQAAAAALETANLSGAQLACIATCDGRGGVHKKISSVLANRGTIVFPSSFKRAFTRQAMVS
jgi:hypothetical protein